MAKKKKAAAKKTKTKEMLVVGSKTRDALRAQGCNVSSDVLDAINSMVYWHVEQAALRAKANGRKTVRAHDILVA